VEADGEWHTSDNKYASARWRQSHPKVDPAPSTPPRKMPSSTKPSPHIAAPRNGVEKPNDIEVLVLDSDDEDEGRVKRELSPSFGSGSSGSANQSFDRISVPMTQSQEDIIDLTLDSDSDDSQPITSSTAGKRKSAENISPRSVQASKRVRVDDTQGGFRAMTVRTLPDRHIEDASSSTSSLSGNVFHSNNVQYTSYPGACPTNHAQSPCPPPQPLASPSLQIRFDAPNYPPPSYPPVAFSPAGGQSHSSTYSSYAPRGLGGRWA
jgi:E3 SUMO-protein ligase PIAS1